jgi:hypothetical protein
MYQMAQCNIPEDLNFQQHYLRTSNLTVSLYDIIEQNIYDCHSHPHTSGGVPVRAWL